MHRIIAAAAASLVLTAASGCASDEPVKAAKPAKETAPATKEYTPTNAELMEEQQAEQLDDLVNEEPIESVDEVVEAATAEEPEPMAEDEFLGEVDYADEPAEPVEPDMTRGQENALESAFSYLDSGSFSKKGLISQLKYEEFSQSEAKFAVNNVDADWKDEAVESAESYLDSGSFSRQGLLEQLLYEKFTPAQAEHAVSEVY